MDDLPNASGSGPEDMFITTSGPVSPALALVDSQDSVGEHSAVSLPSGGNQQNISSSVIKLASGTSGSQETGTPSVPPMISPLSDTFLEELEFGMLMTNHTPLHKVEDSHDLSPTSVKMEDTDNLPTALFKMEIIHDLPMEPLKKEDTQGLPMTPIKMEDVHDLPMMPSSQESINYGLSLLDGTLSPENIHFKAPASPQEIPSSDQYESSAFTFSDPAEEYFSSRSQVMVSSPFPSPSTFPSQEAGQAHDGTGDSHLEEVGADLGAHDDQLARLSGLGQCRHLPSTLLHVESTGGQETRDSTESDSHGVDAIVAGLNENENLQQNGLQSNSSPPAHNPSAQPSRLRWQGRPTNCNRARAAAVRRLRRLRHSLPGRNEPGFVPFGSEGVASAAQGNRWPIDRRLMEQIIAAERGVGVEGEYGRRVGLSYKAIKGKYDEWKSAESTLRGIKRCYQLPKEHRERKPTWGPEHREALVHAVPLYTGINGKISWLAVAKYIKEHTGKPFGVGTVAKEYNRLPQDEKCIKCEDKVTTQELGKAEDEDYSGDDEDGMIDVEENDGDDEDGMIDVEENDDDDEEGYIN
ncbi:hypothetical protein M406DRAFT_66015 [Cryphonectria parasitica EP155]|uniref:Uncharacterized protein n=1 Tax=Cryphonectria parasitica (strain ATCC 38755 / EP155) TaxID=660469 RepID=A0A9P4Y9N2_CRYP1|nr:uncharacterized protein M406DRAFT_66015 [Cryphonectria parasitica EP155]KAF3769524.1 hypothetical protein M406DRAFT_66015 [Cryphonectria parasitica EP155]